MSSNVTNLTQAEKMRILESGEKTENQIAESPRVVNDFAGFGWKMERMRPGQGDTEGIGNLTNELSGNNFSWNTAKVPGDVYTDLYMAGEIDDPFYGRNMGKCKWVEDYEWWYNYSFNIDKNLKGKNLTLLFEGIDYSCSIYLNGKYLGDHVGMFSSFKFDITNLVDYNTPHVPSNLLAIKINPPPKNQKNIAGLKHNFSGDYLTGLVPFGIWKDIKLIATNKVYINDLRVETELKDGSADVEISGIVEGLVKESINSEIKIELIFIGNAEASKKVRCTVKHGTNNFKGSLKLDDPKLWWPYELGKPNRYTLRVTVISENCELDTLEKKVGLRTVRLEHNPGFTKEQSELPWTFVINNKKMFLRSACWGGQPSFFYGRNTYERYRNLLLKVKDCNINNLRIFGWHPPETEDFYDICDELGITVWTNFAFATQVFRDDEEYLNKVFHETAEIVKDRRLHPSTVIWMGGEEVFFSEAHVHSHNRKLMEQVGKVTRENTSVPYADASPLSSREAIRMGYKPNESFHANSHYYAAGLVFMEDYYPKLDYCIIPELTASSSPSVESLKKFIPKDELWPMGLSFGYHAGDMHVLEILNYEVFGDTCMDSLEHFVDATQIAQGTIFQFALEHFRRMKPHVSGVSLCHFITNWPMIKWDIVDYYGVEKKSYDFVKRSYQPLLPSMQFNKRRYLPGETFEGSIFVINDYYKVYNNLKLIVELFNDEEKLAAKKVFTVDVEENSSQKFGNILWRVEGKRGKTFTVKLRLENPEGVIISDNEYKLLELDQEACKRHAKELNEKMIEKRNEYGRGYYRYASDQLDLS